MKSKTSLILAFLVITIAGSTVEASWLSKNVKKAGNWPGQQLFGSTPKNANAAAGAAKIAANKASTLADTYQAIAPQIESVLNKINNSWGYLIAGVMTVMGLLCALLVPKVVGAWRSGFRTAPKSTEPTIGTTPLA